MNPVFVYGTLKRGFPVHNQGMKGHPYLGRFRTCVRYPLVVGGRWYSPILIDEPGIGHRVLGEVFEVGDRALEALDSLEGTHLPIGYRRVEVAVEKLNDGTRRTAWTYVKARARIDVIHSDMLAEYRPDPRYVPAAERPDWPGKTP